MEQDQKVEKRYQVGNFLFSVMTDQTIIVTTVRDVVIGIYKSGEAQTLSLDILLKDNSDASKELLKMLCINLLLAHQNVLVDAKYLSKATDLYAKMYKRLERIKQISSKGIVEEEQMTEEEMLDDVERLETIRESNML